MFLLSPAYCGGRRAGLALKPESAFPVAQQLRAGTLELGAAFAFFSGLYFRGKLAYAQAFDPAGATLIITPTRGLMSPRERVTPELIREFAAVDVALDDWRYRGPLERDVKLLARDLPPGAKVVLLGSVSSGKYVDLLLPLLGDRVHYPTAFVGRGDMSRGGLLLRCVNEGAELDYEPLKAGARPRGPRPPKLDPLTRPGSKLKP
ncbi:MAG: hypothetical protein Q8T13_17705 [Acidobacteriota bacterium]|nr:hypothetical protein [Acidobacteriota bacterium]